MYLVTGYALPNLTQCEGTSPPARGTLAGEGAPPKGTYRELRLDCALPYVELLGQSGSNDRIS